MRRILLVLVVAMLTLVPITANQAQAWHICDHFSDATPDGLRGAITALCWAYLVDLPDDLGDLDDWARNGGVR